MDNLQSILEAASAKYRGPGGAIAVVKDGELAGQHVWGFSNLYERTPMTSSTSLPICSISKHMVCAVLRDLYRNPTQEMLSAASAAGSDVQGLFTTQLHEMLGADFCKTNGLTVEHLCNNQSGIRDYWAETVLWGAKPDGPFSLEEDAPKARKLIKSLHFKPGTEYSYSNVNFHILARIMEQVSQTSMNDLLQKRLFGPAGMKTAKLHPPTKEHNDHCVGYEGDELRGFFTAINNMEWSGDAGIIASLEDMVNYEKYLHRTSSDPETWYGSLLKLPWTYDDGTPSMYLYGLASGKLSDDVTAIGHGGALRGYRLSRKHVVSEGLSVIVLFNHEAASAEAADFVLKEILGLGKSTAPATSTAIEPAKEWCGKFLDRDTMMAVVVEASKTKKDELSIRFARSPETVKLVRSSEGHSREILAGIDGDILRVVRLRDNRIVTATRLKSRDSDVKNTDQLLGRYTCAEIESTLTLSGKGGMLYGSFDGFLGQGPPHLVRYLGEDVWLLACPRSLDAAPPGDWTLVFERDDQGAVLGVTVGCWLARRLKYNKDL